MIAVEAWSRAFLLTWVVELLVAVPLLGQNERRVRRAAAVTLAQLASHPPVWFILPAWGWPRPVFLLVAESWAIAVELALYVLVFGQPWLRAFGIAALANGASLGAGLLLL